MLLQLIESLGMKALEIPTHPKTGPSIDALELALNAGLVQAVLLIPNANNPLGSIMPEANKQRLAGLVAHYQIPLIEDDVYGDLCFTPERPWPVKAYDTSGNVMLCSSFSKALSPGARVGYVLAGRYAQEVAVLKMVSSGATSHFFQTVLADFLTGSAYETQVRKMRQPLDATGRSGYRHARRAVTPRSRPPQRAAQRRLSAVFTAFFAFQAPFLALRRIPIAGQDAFRYSTTIPQHLNKPTPEGEHHEHR